MPAHARGVVLESDDVLVIAQKIVSKSEGMLHRLDRVAVSDYARELSRELDKDPALVELILGESRADCAQGRAGDDCGDPSRFRLR